MTPELTMLALAGLLQILQFVGFSIAANLQVGPKTALGPRDAPIQLTGRAGRLQRAMNNHFEGLILFTIAVVCITYSDKSTGLTMLASVGFVAARVLYVPAYVFAWTPWRSLIWTVGLGCTVFIMGAALL